MAALIAAAHPHTPRSIQTAARGVLRQTQQGVGRGNRYNGYTPGAWLQSYSTLQASRASNAQRSKAATAGKARAKAVHSGTVTVPAGRNAGHPPKAAKVRKAAQAQGNKAAAKVAA
jgi:hypothetical protein